MEIRALDNKHWGHDYVVWIALKKVVWIRETGLFSLISTNCIRWVQVGNILHVRNCRRHWSVFSENHGLRKCFSHVAFDRTFSVHGSMPYFNLVQYDLMWCQIKRNILRVVAFNRNISPCMRSVYYILFIYLFLLDDGSYWFGGHKNSTYKIGMIYSNGKCHTYLDHI